MTRYADQIARFDEAIRIVKDVGNELQVVHGFDFVSRANGIIQLLQTAQSELRACEFMSIVVCFSAPEGEEEPHDR